MLIAASQFATLGCGPSSAKRVSQWDLMWFDDEPIITYRPTPEYPDEALKAGLNGYVTVMFFVESDGSIAHVEAVSASDPLFIKEAMKVARYYTFLPARKDGRTIRAKVPVQVHFRIKERQASYN